MKTTCFGRFSLAWFLPLATLLSSCSEPSGGVTVATKESALTSQGGLDAQFNAHSVWNEGYCGEVNLTNTHGSASVGDWSVTLNLENSQFQNGWRGNFEESSGSLTVTPKPYNATIAPGASTNFGFCATRNDSSIASVAAVTDDLPGSECEEGTVDPFPTRVEVRVSEVDDYVYFAVNGLTRKIWNYEGPDQDQIIDVTPWFRNGDNEVEIQAANRGGPGDYSIELWVDGTLVLDESCPSTVCPDAEQGIFFDEQLTVNLDGLPEAQSVNISGAPSGALYVDDRYTGLSTPTSLTLPPGDYTLGLGQSDDTPGDYSGQFHEQDISVGTCPQDVDLGSAPTPEPNTTQVAILPVRQTNFGNGNIGVLDDSDVPYMVEQAAATNDTWVEPFSYGLTEWNVSAEPIVENAILDAQGDGSPDTGQLLVDAGLEHLHDEYDMVVCLYSSFAADGSFIEGGSIWAGDQRIAYHTAWMRDLAQGEPSEGFYHETLHIYESYNNSVHGTYAGIEGLHGAEEHGYVRFQNGEGDWLAFYRPFARGQVKELASMSADVDLTEVPDDVDLFIGVFDAMRHGTSAPASN